MLNTYDVGSQALYPDLDGIVYLTGVSTPEARATNRYDVGYLETPESDPVLTQTRFYEFHAADNGCFNSSKPGRSFDGEKWLSWLMKIDLRGCLFAALPDVLNWIEDPENGKLFPVGDWQATLDRGAEYVDVVKRLGFPAAIVLQDGAKDLDEIPFDVDAVFVGGSDDFKLGPDAARIVGQARARGLWSHMGRVNSYKRLSYARSIGCDSADGTFLKFCRKADQPEQFGRVISWLDRVNG